MRYSSTALSCGGPKRPFGVTLATYFPLIRALVAALIALGVYFVSGTSPVKLKPAQLGTGINKSARSTLGLSLSRQT